MKATRDQIIFLKATLWPDACEAQQWNVKDRALQMQVLSSIVGRTIESSNELEKIKEFGLVKRRLLELAGNLDGPLDNAPEDEARRLRHHIRTELLPCIALYVPDAEKYLREIINDGIHHGRRVEQRGLDELTARPRVRFDARLGDFRESPGELQQVIMTLNGRLNSAHPPGLRNRAGDSLHDMRIKAGVGCGCKVCGNWAAAGLKFDRHFHLVPLDGTAAAPTVQTPDVPVPAGVEEGDDPF